MLFLLELPLFLLRMGLLVVRLFFHLFWILLIVVLLVGVLGWKTILPIVF